MTIPVRSGRARSAAPGSACLGLSFGIRQCSTARRRIRGSHAQLHARRLQPIGLSYNYLTNATRTGRSARHCRPSKARFEVDIAESTVAVDANGCAVTPPLAASAVARFPSDHGARARNSSLGCSTGQLARDHTRADPPARARRRNHSVRTTPAVGCFPHGDARAPGSGRALECAGDHLLRSADRQVGNHSQAASPRSTLDSGAAGRRHPSSTRGGALRGYGRAFGGRLRLRG